MSFEITPDDVGTRLDVFLSRALRHVSRSQILNLNRAGRIRVNQVSEKAGYRLRPGDKIDMTWPEPESAGPEAEPIPLDVLYEDSHLVVVEKPAGMVVHPGAGNRGQTMVNALMARFGDLSDLGGAERPGIVHRLDKLTSGLMIVARTNEAHRRLSASFEQRRVRKGYLAAIHGIPRNETGRIELSIGRHPRNRTRMAAHTRQGRSAFTEYRVRERLRRFSMADVTIRTGRTHQIRVHFSAIGHPVVGDATYGRRQHADFLRTHPDPGRYFLHASRIEFPHPLTGEGMAFESRLPPDLVNLWELLRADR